MFTYHSLLTYLACPLLIFSTDNLKKFVFSASSSIILLTPYSIFFCFFLISSFVSFSLFSLSYSLFSWCSCTSYSFFYSSFLVLTPHWPPSSRSPEPLHVSYIIPTESAHFLLRGEDGKKARRTPARLSPFPRAA